MITQKAVKFPVFLGRIKSDGFQLPGGSYGMSQTQILEAVDIEPKRYTQIRNSKVGESLALSSVDLYPIKLENGSKVNIVPLDKVPLIWRACAKLKRGNQEKLDDLMDAALIEALERRFDKAAGVQRTEEERNSRLEARTTGKVARRKFTDQIKQWSEDSGREIVDYGGFTLEVYRRTGLHWSFINYKKSHNDSKFRDTLDAETLRILERFEDNCVSVMYTQDLEPLAAIEFTHTNFGLSKRRDLIAA